MPGTLSGETTGNRARQKTRRCSIVTHDRVPCREVCPRQHGKAAKANSSGQATSPTKELELPCRVGSDNAALLRSKACYLKESRRSVSVKPRYQPTGSEDYPLHVGASTAHRASALEEELLDRPRHPMTPTTCSETRYGRARSSL